MASVPFQSSKWTQTPGNTSLAAVMNSSIEGCPAPPSVGGVLTHPEVERVVAQRLPFVVPTSSSTGKQAMPGGTAAQAV